MALDELFTTEEKTIEQAEKFLEIETDLENPLREAYAELLANYKKMYKQLTRLIKINDKQQLKLNEANIILERHSKHDELTGIFNRRMFNEMYLREWRRSARYNQRVSILMLDIDHFKSVNDTYGHQAGDELLKITAKKIDEVGRRAGDIAARFGGEEFVLLLHDIAELNAFKIAESIRENIAGSYLEYRGKTIKITVSIGIASMVPDLIVDREKLVWMADQALYLAKRTGRNRVCVYKDAASDGKEDAGRKA